MLTDSIPLDVVLYRFVVILVRVSDDIVTIVVGLLLRIPTVVVSAPTL